MKPIFELNKMNVLRMVSMLSRNSRKTLVSPVVLKDSFGRDIEEIKKIMEDLVACGLLIREEMNVEEELGSKFVEHFGTTVYKRDSNDFFVMDGIDVLKHGIKFEEANNLDASEILYNILLERDKRDYHALFCLSRVKRKRGFFDSRLVNSALEEAKKQKATEDVLEVINEEIKLMLSTLQNKNSDKPDLKFTEEGKYNFEITHTENRTSSAKLEQNKILLKISKLIPEEMQIKVIDSLKRRIMKNIENGVIVETQKEELKDFKDGDVIEVGSEKYALRIFYEDKKSSSARLEGTNIRFSISGNLSEEEKKMHARDLIRMVISNHRLPKLKQIVKEINERHFNVNVNDIKFKKQESRWGSCSGHGNINISYRLLFAPEDILRYVCVHELAHLIKPNHSEEFWKIVKNVVPDYKEKIEWLKKYGSGLDI